MKLGLVVGGLVAVGALIGGLTYAYWRHTRPDPYLEALDVLGESSRGPDAALLDTTLVGAAATSPIGTGNDSEGDDEVAAGGSSIAGSVGATALGAVAAERASSARQSTTAQTQAFRIVDPVPDKSPTESTGADHASIESAKSTDPDPTPVTADEPLPIVTLEDLFGAGGADSTDADKAPAPLPLERLWEDGTEPTDASPSEDH